LIRGHDRPQDLLELQAGRAAVAHRILVADHHSLAVGARHMQAADHIRAVAGEDLGKARPAGAVAQVGKGNGCGLDRSPGHIDLVAARGSLAVGADHGALPGMGSVWGQLLLYVAMRHSRRGILTCP
jgi:hypothetical protein